MTADETGRVGRSESIIRPDEKHLPEHRDWKILRSGEETLNGPEDAEADR